MPIPSPVRTARPLLRDLVYDRIVTAIVDGELEPGQVLVDKELEQWLGTSRTPIRDALNRLSSTGLVEILPQKYTRVAPVDLPRFADILEVLSALYSAAIGEVVPLLDDNDRAELRELQTYLREGDFAASPIEHAQQITRVLRIFLTSYDNGVLLSVPEKYEPHTLRAIRVMRERVAPGGNIEHLDTLIHSALNGDTERAVSAVRAYFTSSIETVRRVAERHNKRMAV